MPFRKVSYKVHWLRNNHHPFRDQLNLKPISKVRIRQGCIPPASQISYSHFVIFQLFSCYILLGNSYYYSFKINKNTYLSVSIMGYAL